MPNRSAFMRLLAALLVAVAVPALSQTQAPAAFPAKPVRIVNPFPAGSGPDAVARLVGDKLGKAWNQPVVVDNRPGASGFIALQAGMQASPTGHDLTLAAADHMAINPSLFRKLPYNPVKDFVPVSGLYRTAFFVLVASSSPIKSVPQLIAFAKDKTNHATYGSNATGSPLHLGGAQFEAATGSTMQHIPFKETGALYQSVANGEVTWALGSLGSAGSLIQAGKLRVLAVADTRRSPAMPDVPTLAEAGGPADVNATTWVALFAPAATPAAVLGSIGTAVHEALATPDVRSKMMAIGFEPAPVDGDEVARWMRTDTPRYAELVRRTGASTD